MADRQREGSGSVQAEIGKYLDILARDPNSRVFAPLAEAYRKAGLLDDAIETALEGLKVHPNYLGGRVALGRAYFEKKRFAEARAEMEGVVKAAPDNLMAHKVLGHIAWEQGDLSAAEKSFRMVLLLDPRDQEAKQLVEKMGGGPSRPLFASPPPPPPPPAEPLPLPELAAPEAPPPVAAPAPASPEPPQVAAPPPSPLPPPPEPEVEPFVIPTAALEPPRSPEPPTAIAAETLPPPEIEEAALPTVAPVGEPELPEPEIEPFPSVFQIAPSPAAAAETPAGAVPEAPAEAAPESVFEEVPEAVPEAAPEAGPPAVLEGPEEAPEESPFEVFGRSKRLPPPVSDKGEREAFPEIDLELEPTAFGPVGVVTPEGEESPFQIFTREPRREPGESAPRAQRSEGGGFREIDLETSPQEEPVPGGWAPSPPTALTERAAEPGPEEEIPAIDLTREVDLPSPEEEAPFQPAEPAVPETIAREPSTESVPREEIPLVEPVRDGAVARAEEPEERAGVVPGGGVFTTETLASVYLSQGFYGRAADVYRRLLEGRPKDEGLQRKLQEALALERGEQPPAGAEAVPAAAAAEPESTEPFETAAVPESYAPDAELPEPFPEAPAAEPAPAPAGPAAAAGEDETIRQLRVLLESLRGGRPR